MRKKILNYYENASYYKKLKFLIDMVLTAVTLLVLSIGIICVEMISKEIYERNQEKLFMMTSNIEEKFKSVEGVITEIHQNKNIQDNLTYSNQKSENLNLTSMRRELNWLSADQKYFESLIILNQRDEYMVGTIYDKSDFFQNMSLEEIAALVKAKPRHGVWMFDRDLNEAIYVHSIYNTRDNQMKNIGTAIIKVNISFIQEILDNSGVFTDADFFVLEMDGQYFSTNLSGYRSYVNFIENINWKGQKKSYSFHNVNNHYYYVLESNMESNSKEFKCYYFLLNKQMIKKVVQITQIFLLIILAVLTLGSKLLNKSLERLISPINELARLMSQFKERKDYDKLKNLQIPQVAMRRNDEVGILYQSFNNLINQIEELIINDYRAKLLNQEIEYRFLQAQLNPHFLYNTLNSMNFMALKNGDSELSGVITSLAFLLRNKLDNNSRFVSVEEELGVIQAYIKIQKLRFKTRLTYTSDVQEETKVCKIPRLIIQPLIENSVKYGVEKVNRPMEIKLNVYFDCLKLVIKVCDNGPGFKKDIENQKRENKSIGLGLKNIRKRLDLLYSGKAKLEVESIPDKHTTVIICIPQDNQ